MSDYSLGPYFCENPHHALLHHVLHTEVGHYPRGFGDKTEYGVALEFGVGDANSLNCMARFMPVIGFDSFNGLPADWRPGFTKGMFRYDYNEVLENTSTNSLLVPGLFEDTLPGYGWTGLTIRLIHIDCDLYSSTKTVLDNLPWDNICRHKSVLCFDEWHGYPGADQHEQRAFKEFVKEHFIKWEVIGHGHQAWAVRIK